MPLEDDFELELNRLEERGYIKAKSDYSVASMIDLMGTDPGKAQELYSNLLSHLKMTNSVEDQLFMQHLQDKITQVQQELSAPHSQSQNSGEPSPADYYFSDLPSGFQQTLNSLVERGYQNAKADYYIAGMIDLMGTDPGKAQELYSNLLSHLKMTNSVEDQPFMQHLLDKIAEAQQYLNEVANSPREPIAPVPETEAHHSTRHATNFLSSFDVLATHPLPASVSGEVTHRAASAELVSLDSKILHFYDDDRNFDNYVEFANKAKDAQHDNNDGRALQAWQQAEHELQLSMKTLEQYSHDFKQYVETNPRLQSSAMATELEERQMNLHARMDEIQREITKLSAGVKATSGHPQSGVSDRVEPQQSEGVDIKPSGPRGP